LKKLTNSPAEPKWAHYIPGGYSASRCIKMSGRSMLFAIYAFSGCAIMFFGYDTAVMSQVNINNDYLKTMGLYGGTGRDNAALGGMVSLWFGGFAVGEWLHVVSPLSPWLCLLAPAEMGDVARKRFRLGLIIRPLWTCRRHHHRLHCRLGRSNKDDPVRLRLGHLRRGAAGFRAKHYLAGFCPCHQRYRLRPPQHHCPHLDL
jgi:hypothetical protein